MAEAQSQTTFMNDESFARFFSKVTQCQKVAVISDSKDAYIAFFNRPTSTKPIAVAPLASVLMLLEDYIENVLPHIERQG